MNFISNSAQPVQDAANGVIRLSSPGHREWIGMMKKKSAQSQYRRAMFRRQNDAIMRRREAEAARRRAEENEEMQRLTNRRDELEQRLISRNILLGG